MRRRELIAGVGATVGFPSARAQGRLYRLGILANTKETNPTELIKALADYGYVEGQNLVVERRFSEGMSERWLPLATELVALKVDAIVVQTTPAALAAKQATTTIPIVISNALDPVGAGLAESVANPGGNITGLALLSPETTVKGLSLLKEAVPALKRIAVLGNEANPGVVKVRQAVAAVANTLGLTLLPRPVRAPQDFAPAFDAMAGERPDGLLILIDQLAAQYMNEIAAFTGQARLPGVSSFTPFAKLGGLMSYGAAPAAAQRKAAGYVDRVLKGESPATLPFQQPTTFELVINLKTARALGLTIPQLLLAQADEVIE
jgi:putative ABC transport system substrate-binding protein